MTRSELFLSFLMCLSVISTAGAAPLEKTEVTQGHLNSRTLMPPLRFEVGGQLRRNLDFWIKIYSQYDSQQGLVHDAKYVDHVYEVVNLSGGRTNHYRKTREIKNHWRKVLLSLHHMQKNPEKMIPENMTEDQKRVFEMFKDIHEPNKFLNATHRKRLRFQLGQKDRFLEGYYESGQYLGVMEEIFRKEGLPVELTRLPFVESSFNVRARSKVGASGIWQFMRTTGRLFLKINDVVDERNDPIRATEAAAKLLKLNYESLKSWPLAVTAYNHGRQGMMRAVRLVGTNDLEELVSGYRSRRFGFASSNFFTELLAAVEVEKNAEKYFGKVDRAASLQAFEVPIEHFIDVRELCRFLKLDRAKIRTLNPALAESVIFGKRLIPAGYRLRLPWDGQGDREAAVRLFQAGYAQIPNMFKLKRQR